MSPSFDGQSPIAAGKNLSHRLWTLDSLPRLPVRRASRNKRLARFRWTAPPTFLLATTALPKFSADKRYTTTRLPTRLVPWLYTFWNSLCFAKDRQFNSNTPQREEKSASFNNQLKHTLAKMLTHRAVCDLWRDGDWERDDRLWWTSACGSRAGGAFNVTWLKCPFHGTLLLGGFCFSGTN